MEVEDMCEKNQLDVSNVVMKNGKVNSSSEET